MRTLNLAIEGAEEETFIRRKITATVEALLDFQLRALFTFQPESVEYISHTIATTLCLEHPEPGEQKYIVSDFPKVVFAGPVVWNARGSCPWGSGLRRAYPPIGPAHIDNSGRDNSPWNISDRFKPAMLKLFSANPRVLGELTHKYSKLVFEIIETSSIYFVIDEAQAAGGEHMGAFLRTKGEECPVLRPLVQ